MSRVAAFRIAVVALAFGSYALTSLGQPPRPALDPIGEAEARRKIADQKAEADVRDAIKSAESLAKTNPNKAVQTLKTAQTNIDVATAISTDMRKTLTGMLTTKLAQIEGKPLANSGYKPDPNATAIKHDRNAARESASAELKTVNEAIRRIETYKRTGQNREADREIADLGKAYPNNPAVIRLQEQDTFASRVDDAKEYARQQDKRITLALNDVARSSLPAAGDVEFPKDWREKTKRRTEMRLTDKEKKIIEALNKPVTVDWNGKMLEEALQELSNQMDQSLFIDKKSLTDLGIDLNKAVTLQSKGLSARTVLRQLLSAQGLTFVVKDESIQVVTVEKARDMLVTRVYYLGDLVQGVGPFGGVNAGRFLNFQQTMDNVDMIIKAIKSSVDPLCWKDNGGPCTITFHYPSMSIVVKASTEVQSSLGSTFGGGK